MRLHAFQHMFWRCLWEDMNISQRKISDRAFFSSEAHPRLLLMQMTVMKGSKERKCGGGGAERECWERMQRYDVPMVAEPFLYLSYYIGTLLQSQSEYYHPRPGVESVTISPTWHVHVTHYLCVKFLSQLQISMWNYLIYLAYMVGSLCESFLKI